MEKKLSFVLPIYNVEKYLPQCVDSILTQATQECEIILVDDGSPDNCGAICDGYQQKSNLIRVIHKANGGLSAARNSGLEIAEGRYVLFVDSDDYLEEGSVAKLLEWIDTTSADVAFLESRKVYPDGSWESMGEGLVREAIFGKNREEVLHFLATRPKFPASAWGKIYRRAFLQENRIEFPHDRRLSEDLIFSLNLFLAAESFDYLAFPYYCYRQAREGSITNNISPKYYFDTAMFVTEVAERFAKNQKAVSDMAQSALSFAAYEYSILLWHLLCMRDENWDRAYRFLKEYRWILRYGKNKKSRLVNAVVSVAGLRLTARVMDVYMSRR